MRNSSKDRQSGKESLMQYLVSFLEGIITFVSPCLLPMLPIYISYFAGGGERGRKGALISALGFVTGFTIMFVAMGALAGTFGSFLRGRQGIVNVVLGLIVIFFGLNYLGVFKFRLFGGGPRALETKKMGFLPAMLFGIFFSVGWTPCVGVFLGSALALASQQGHATEGMLMLLLYSLGLGLPYIISAVLIDSLKGTFDFIKRNYRVVNIISGCMLVCVGVLMATGYLSKITAMIMPV